MKFGIRSAVDVVFKTTRAYTGVGEDYLLEKNKIGRASCRERV